MGNTCNQATWHAVLVSVLPKSELSRAISMLSETVNVFTRWQDINDMSRQIYVIRIPENRTQIRMGILAWISGPKSLDSDSAVFAELEITWWLEAFRYYIIQCNLRLWDDPNLRIPGSHPQIFCYPMIFENSGAPNQSCRFTNCNI